MVSIVCCVYNHENYLKKTLESFVSQKTNYEYEIIVHDDASTDGSASIIREFENKYPKLFNCIYQVENQFSKGINIFNTYIKDILRGKYVAFCEGDDWWIDDKKIAKQTLYMEEHPGCTFCFTNAIMSNVQTGKERLMLPYDKNEAKQMTNDGIYNTGQLAKLLFIPYASFFLPVQNYSKFPESFFEKYFGGDRKTSLFSTSLGYAYCINEPMCCYHYGVRNSALTKKRKKEELAKIERSFVKLNNNLNEFTNFVYDDVFRESNLYYLRNILMFSRNNKCMTKEEYCFVRKNDTFKTVLVRTCVRLMPNFVFFFLRSLKKKL